MQASNRTTEQKRTISCFVWRHHKYQLTFVTEWLSAILVICYNLTSSHCSFARFDSGEAPFQRANSYLDRCLSRTMTPLTMTANVFVHWQKPSAASSFIGISFLCSPLKSKTTEWQIFRPPWQPYAHIYIYRNSIVDSRTRYCDCNELDAPQSSWVNLWNADLSARTVVHSTE